MQIKKYLNVIEMAEGVKLCVSENVDTDYLSMEVLVPYKLLADDENRTKLSDVFNDLAMYILSLET